MRYLLVSYIRKPDGQYDEIISVSTKIKKNDWVDQRVILDYKEQKVLKAAVNNTVATKDWDQVSSYYEENYPEVTKHLKEECKAS